MYSYRTIVAVIVLLSAIAVPSYSDTSKEEKIGDKYAAEFEKRVQLVTDEAILERVNRIGMKLAEVAKRREVPADYGSSTLADFNYQFKVVEDPDINALAFPGGRIYVFKGLLDFVQSDHELAGVLGHEIAHASHHHSSYLIRKQSRIDIYVALIAIAGGLGRINGRDLQNVLYGAQSVRTAKLTGLGREAELDADRTGAIYAAEAGYNPMGILEFLQRLTDYQQEKGEVRNLGIFQTHPNSEERSMRLAEQLRESGINIDVRKIANLSRAKVEPTTVDGKDVWRVVIEDRPVITLGDSGGMTSKERADLTSSKINSLLYKNLDPQEIHIAQNRLLCGDNVVVEVCVEDCEAAKLSETQMLKQAESTLRYALWSDWVKMECKK